MDIQPIPTEKPYVQPTGERRGLLIVNTGNGKGKSTAAFGLAMRAFGRIHVHGKKVKIFQFMKVPTARFGEHRVFEQLGLEVEGLGDGFSWNSRDLEASAQLARDGWARVRAAIDSDEYFMIMLDELTYPLHFAWLSIDEVLAVFRDRPKGLHLVVTGRNCPSEIIELADTVTEMTSIKHAFESGIPAQRGIED